MAANEQSLPRTRNPRGQGQILRQQLIDAAAHLLATLDQPETLTLRQVARTVGVAPASIYSHFADFEALFNHVLDLRYDELISLMKVADKAPTALAELVWRCATYIRWGIHNPGAYRTLFGGRVPPGVTATSHRVGLELLEALTASLAATVADIGDESPDTIRQRGILLWTSMHGLVSAYCEHPGVVWPRISDLIIGTVALHSSRPLPDIAHSLQQLTDLTISAGATGTAAH
ncbi:TetR/AcrR family transcriptional regulator [Glaciihabitans sp. dw_435]|uniref:TetR/AcrR family transcriptional regulator n=1 Tax=Glaciihabitans sp. dw_435 TaxID=2720081 RepID=UPI001BD529E1|nr:TetR/AcrR family transcriptional regulator [Glaciihabitans sp. dw_435]